MAEYYPSIKRWIVPLSMATLILGPASYWGFTARDLEKGLIAFITSALLAGMYYLAISRVRHPVVSVAGNQICVKKLFFGTRAIEDLRQYKLVLSGDFLAFRKDGEQDIMVDKADFSSSQWDILVSDLKCLPFAGQV